MADRTIFIDDAAQALGVSRRTVYYRIREGRLRTIHTRCGSQRVLVSSIETLLREIAEAKKSAAGAPAPACVDVLESQPLTL